MSAPIWTPTYAAWHDEPTEDTAINAASLNNYDAFNAAVATFLATLSASTVLSGVQASATSSGALVVSKHNPLDCTSGSLSFSLPTGHAGAFLSAERVDNATANTCTLTGSIRGVGASSITLLAPAATASHESLFLFADASGSWWPIAGHKTKSWLDALYLTTARILTAGTGLTGGGDLTADRTFAVAYGTTSGTAAQGNDSRITGAEQAANKNAASGYAGLDGSSKVAIGNLPTGTTSSTVTIGNDTRVVNAAQLPVAAWAASTAVAANTLYRLPTGGLAYVTAGRTTRSSFDATERAAWTFLPGGHYELSTSGTTWVCPTGITQLLRLQLQGAGGGGGGGGSATTSGGVTGQVGGGGGGAGATFTVGGVAVTATTSYTQAIGAAGTSGAGGAANNNPGSNGGVGGDTTIVIGGVTYTAAGGSGGKGSLGNSTTAANGGVYGAGALTTTGTSFVPGTGGIGSTSGFCSIPNGPVIGGGGGCDATATLGGTGGTARTAPGANVSTISTNTGTTAGGAGTAPTELGCGGGGGGGGSLGGAGGAGGAGTAGSAGFWF
jgi:hypothetical protein